ncbi:MAG TPA: BON domain-containing protein [Acidimicrobiales bacterium]|nr:BON domain-containing protein [Acidimicrobiales bacterium]
MRRLFRTLLPTSRIGLALWTWRNRYRVLDWLGFGMRAAGDLAGGRGGSDGRAELRLRAALARDPMTRGLAIEVRVERGVARLAGRVTPEVHARIQDLVLRVPGVDRVDDRLVNASTRRRGLRLRTS